MADMPCRWCGASTFLTFRFDMASFGAERLWFVGVFGKTDDPYPLCVVHREWRQDWVWESGATGWDCTERSLSHQCSCGHSSSYHNVRVFTDHAAVAAGPGGVPLCRSCARFVAVGTRRRLQPLDRERYGYEAPALTLEEVDELFDDPLEGLTQSEVAQAARKFFRKFEGVSS